MTIGIAARTTGLLFILYRERLALMKKQILAFVKQADRLTSELYLKAFPERPAVLVFFFHGVFRDEAEMNCNLVGSEGLTVQRFRQFVDYGLEHGYTFVSADALVNGLDPRGRYILTTFDDGYANNQLILPILREYRIPATFFISTGHVKDNCSFWWDILLRERTRHGVPGPEIVRETESLKPKPFEAIEKYVRDQFGERAFQPVGDIDRPLTLSELREMSRDPYVCLGNHTHNHAILTTLSEDQIRSQISQAQNVLRDATGKVPTAIAYPNGRYSDAIVDIAMQVGLQVGFTVVPAKNYLPIHLPSSRAMRLSRFHLARGQSLQEQLTLFRSDISFYARLRTRLNAFRQSARRS